jgi:hypothetical protein
MRSVVLLALAMTFLGCGSAEDYGIGPRSDSGAIDTLAVSGEIGIELGDTDYVFGVIVDVAFTQNGEILVLDGRASTVKAYSPDGLYLGSFGGRGEAPGEFQNPRSMAVLADGRIAVADPFGGKVELYSGDFSHYRTFNSFAGRAPMVIAGTSGGFAGEQSTVSRTEGTIVSRLAIWDIETDSMLVLAETESTFSPESMVERFMKPSPGMAFSDGTLYYYAPESQQYLIQVFQPDGTQGDPLTLPGYAPVEKTQAELQEDMEDYEARMLAMSSSGRGGMMAQAEYEPHPWHYAVSSIGSDSRGRIWVQRGWETCPVFDVFNPGETIPSLSVAAPLELSGYSFVVTPLGFAAFHPDPDDWPKVVLLQH